MKLDLEQFAPEHLAKDTLYGGSVDIDWSTLRENPDSYDIHLPPITADILDNHMSEWREQFPESDYDDEADRLEAAAAEFTASDGWYEWRDDFEPMMNYAYPIDLRYGADREECAANIDALAGCMSLVTIGDQDYLALSGGGMDLSWNICAAFIACGCVPPLKYLRNLPAYSNNGPYRSNLRPEFAALVVACLPAAAECLRHAADRLEKDAAGLVRESTDGR